MKFITDLEAGFTAYATKVPTTITYSVDYWNHKTAGQDFHHDIGTIFPVYRYADGTDATTRQAWEVTGSTARFSTIAAAAKFLVLRHRSDTAFNVTPVAVTPPHDAPIVRDGVVVTITNSTEDTGFWQAQSMRDYVADNAGKAVACDLNGTVYVTVYTPLLALPAMVHGNLDTPNTGKHRRATCHKCGMFRAAGHIGWGPGNAPIYQCRVCGTKEVARFYSDAPRAVHNWVIDLPANMAWANLEAEQDYLNRQQDGTLGELEFATKQLREMHRGFLPYARISTQMRAIERAAADAAEVAEALEAVYAAKATLYATDPAVARLVDGEYTDNADTPEWNGGETGRWTAAPRSVDFPDDTCVVCGKPWDTSIATGTSVAFYCRDHSPTVSGDTTWTPPEFPAMGEADCDIAATDEAARCHGSWAVPF
jgi:hypothetical protein